MNSTLSSLVSGFIYHTSIGSMSEDTKKTVKEALADVIASTRAEGAPKALQSLRIMQ